MAASAVSEQREPTGMEALTYVKWYGVTIFPNKDGTFNVNISFYQRGAFQCFHGVSDVDATLREAVIAHYQKTQHNPP